MTHRNYSDEPRSWTVCQGCTAPIATTYHRPDSCLACKGLPTVDMLKDGSRGYLWAWVPPELHSAPGLDTWWIFRVSRGERARDLLPHGWASTVAEALAAASAAVGQRVARAGGGYGGAHAIKREYLAERKTERTAKAAARNQDSRGSSVVEFLYEVSCGYDEYDGQWQWREHLTAHRIVKRTAKRVFFDQRYEQDGRIYNEPYRTGDDGIRYVDAAELERPREHGAPRARCGSGWNSYYLYTELHAQEELARERRGRDEQARRNREWQASNGRDGDRERPTDAGEFSVKECRRQMQRHHPDKGGDAALFRLWRSRFEAATRAARSAGASATI